MRTRVVKRRATVGAWAVIVALAVASWYGTSAVAQPQAPDFSNNLLECQAETAGHLGPDVLIFGTVLRGETLTFTLHIINTGTADVPSEGNPAIRFEIFNYGSRLKDVQVLSIPAGATVNSVVTDSIIVDNIACAAGDTVRVVWSGVVRDPGPEPQGYRNWISTHMVPQYYNTWPGWYARQEPAAYFRMDGVPGSIGDWVFEDVDGDGVPDAGEPGIAGVVLKLYRDSDGSGTLDPAVDVLVGDESTDESGSYRFTDVSPGVYFVDVDETTLPPAMTLTSGHDPAGPIEISFGTSYDEADFGYHREEWALDFGDAIDPRYPTYLANNGPRHRIGNLYLGGWINAETDCKQTDMDQWDDGVVFLGSSPTSGGPYQMPYVSGTWGAVQITVRGTPRQVAYVDGWIDWNIDGDWDDDYEHVVDVAVPIPNVYVVEFWVPEGAPAGDGWARFRVYEKDYDSYVGLAENGEVEDYFLLDGQVPVEMNLLKAIAYNDRVKIQWVTQSETENLGFSVMRAVHEAGPYERITSSLIPGAGTTQVMHSYEYVDRTVTAGQTYYYKVVDVDLKGNVGEHGPVAATVPRTPERFELEQNFPNPFNPVTTIGFRLPTDSRVQVKIYNLMGRLVRTLVDGAMNSGRHEVRWDGTDDYGVVMPTGTYLCVMEAEGMRMTKKLVFAK
ncbi:MAG: GEVED domain-containing protein [candidate division KSB1 bacterium]|nr:GEVED domain-containing protein [candidate division KSB1 bacterium]MDZ7295123.1 GEVED domain-containing protein [candidate division KSB1 bacterium]MDZ7385427.1 GEVED domain-containing protein [candidate division KSB1 bacterium]MDZ7392863.1 GEVED domain-containing protein [candidate division KSB1 bacterium]MDZ7411927.1 GEVED domain-containing protein [candidate division KSB1 bacterium]